MATSNSGAVEPQAPGRASTGAGSSSARLARWLALGLGAGHPGLRLGRPADPAPARAGRGRGLRRLHPGQPVLAAAAPGHRRALGVAHDMADALAVGLGAASTGGLASPIWLLLYPHVVAVSVRGGLALRPGDRRAGRADRHRRWPSQPGRSRWRCCTPWPSSSARSWAAPPARTSKAVQARLARGEPRTWSAGNLQLSQTRGRPRGQPPGAGEGAARLRESEERYRRLLERIQDGVVIIQDGRVAYANQVFGRHGRATAPAALVGTDFRELVPPEDRAEIGERYRALGGEPGGLRRPGDPRCAPARARRCW